MRACKTQTAPALAYLGRETACWPTHTAEKRHLARSSMLFAVLKRTITFALLAASLLTTVAAQEDSTVQDDVTTSSAPPDPSPYPTATIFLPGSLHGLPGDGRNLAASVIAANANQTAYAIACMYNAANSSAPGPQGCSLQSTITVTGGESTLIYTYNPIVTTDNGMPGTSIPSPPTSTTHSGATINCNLAGGTRATAATCTGSSQIEGLGLVASSTTLASTQINYATLTITAGRALLAAASEAAAAEESGDAGAGDGGEGDVKSAASSERVWEPFFYAWVLVTLVLGVGVL